MCDDAFSIPATCGRDGFKGVTSNKKFLEDYNDITEPYMVDYAYPEEICEIPSIEVLQCYAENEFRDHFHLEPTHGVYAPGLINISGESTDFNTGKILSMAIPLFTVIVGLRRGTSKWCQVKMISRQEPGDDFFEFFINTNGLKIKETSWINYIKGAIRCFRVRRELIPGFKIVIMSSIPARSGLGSSSALTVAMYTFLEAITNVYTVSVIEKGLACQLGEHIDYTGTSGIEALFSVTGSEGQVISVDTRSLEIEAYDWKPLGIDLVLIKSARNVIDGPTYRKWCIQLREIAFALNVSSLRDATIEDVSRVETLFSEDLIRQAKHVVRENARVNEATKFIKENHWKKLGRLIRESQSSMRHDYGSSCVEVEDIIEAVQNVKGVLGARMTGRGFGGCVFVMVQRNAIRAMIDSLRHIIESQEYHVITPARGAGILFKDTVELPLKVHTQEYHAKKAARYHLPLDTDMTAYILHYYETKDKDFGPYKSVSLFIDGIEDFSKDAVL